MTVRKFAVHIGVSDRMVSHWERGGAGIIPRPSNQDDDSLKTEAQRFTGTRAAHQRSLHAGIVELFQHHVE
ncbi:hypothetical protein [Streptomyces sp. NPDC056549]|uniref:hypothetical protein n=1 Tax=Streptomyces sp. NPDC056549 TaxID=3345864 RepID=UPI0036D0054E